MKLTNKQPKQKSTKTPAKVIAVRAMAILLAALFIITGLVSVLPVIF